MLVRAKEGTKCPMEGQPRTYIGDDAFVEVPSSAYYRRLVRDGSLDTPDKAPKEAEAKAKAAKKSGGDK